MGKIEGFIIKIRDLEEMFENEQKKYDKIVKMYNDMLQVKENKIQIVTKKRQSMVPKKTFDCDKSDTSFL